jgi:hypothetical protein
MITNTGLQYPAPGSGGSRLAKDLMERLGPCRIRPSVIWEAAQAVAAIIDASGVRRDDGVWELPAERSDDFPLAISFLSPTQSRSWVFPVSWTDVGVAYHAGIERGLTAEVLKTMAVKSASRIPEADERVLSSCIKGLMPTYPAGPSMRWFVIGAAGIMLTRFAVFDGVVAARPQG